MPTISTFNNREAYAMPYDSQQALRAIDWLRVLHI